MKKTGRKTRTAKSLTLDSTLLAHVVATQGNGSTSERVNELLRRAILEEQYDRLEGEAAKFFAPAAKEERTEARAFERASRRSLARE